MVKVEFNGKHFYIYTPGQMKQIEHKCHPTA
jgi:hypothetical protein